MYQIDRRGFLKSSIAVTGGAFAISGTKSSGNILGANERIRVAVAGIHGRGGLHRDHFAKMKGVEVAYLVDPDNREFGRSVKRVQDAAGNTPETAQDIREVLDDPTLNAVSIATPNHWHSLMTIWACQSGKDVYVEKPCSHNIHEGRIAVEAARKFNRIVQHGTQQRSDPFRANEIAAVHSGKYGKLLVSRGYCCKTRRSIGLRETESPPPALDFNLWLGPAGTQPYHGNLVHYNWHWFWDFGNGDTGNQGVHEMDVARWAIQGATLPKRVFSLGGRFGYQDQGQTPNTQLTAYEYDDALLLFETRGLVGKKQGVARIVGNEYYTTDGLITDGKFYPNGHGEGEPLARFETGVTLAGTCASVDSRTDAERIDDQDSGYHRAAACHLDNFIDAVRSRNASDLNADIEIGHYSSALCHLSNISYRLGTMEKWDGQLKRYGDNKQVADAFENIADGFKKFQVPLRGLQYRVGRVLDINPQLERFIDDDEANQLLTRPARKPFDVPEKLA